MFLLGAAAAGVVAGRLTSGVKAVHADSAPRNGGRPVPAGANYVDPAPAYTGYAAAPRRRRRYGDRRVETTGTPLPPPPYGTVPPAGSVVPPTTPAGWDDPARGTGEVR